MLHRHPSPKGPTMAAIVIELARRDNREYLTENQRLQMRYQRMQGTDIDVIARAFGVSRSCAYITTKGYAPLKRAVKPVSEAWSAQIMECLPQLRLVAYGFDRRKDRAEDLLQDTIVRALGKELLFEPGTNLMGWLCTIMRNIFYGQYRLQREDQDSDGLYAAKALRCLPEQGHKMDLESLIEALNRLPPQQAEAIRLVCIQGLKYDEAADQLDCSIGTIKSRLNRGREALSKLLGIDGSDFATDGVLAASLES